MSVILRSKFPKEKTVLLLNDQPFKNEVQDGEKFSSAANTGLLTALRTGKCNNYSGITPDGYKGIVSTDIYQTYLDYEPFNDGNFDYTKEVRKRKGLSTVEDEVYLVDEEEPGTKWYKLEHQKDVYITERLYKELQGLIEEIRTVKPKLVIVTGKWGLFFLTGVVSVAQTQGNYKDKKPLGGLSTFRSSILKVHEVFGIVETIVVPIYHTLSATAMPDKVHIMNLDLQKLGWMYHVIIETGISFFTEPERDIILGTELDIVTTYFKELLDVLDKGFVEITTDIETKYHSMIDCIGYCYSDTKAICIPFATMKNPNYWSVEEEIEVMLLIREVTLHPNARFVLQNGSYDAQYFYVMWALILNVYADSMIMHHVLYNYLPKSLDFMASLYCTHYTYWKNMQIHK